MNEYVEYYVDAFRRYAQFDGRAKLAQFWYFVLISILISIVLSAMSHALSSLYSLVVFVPSIAITARRLHDIGKSGWMQLVALIPLVGIIWLIVLLVQESDGDNVYGAKLDSQNKNGGDKSAPQEAEIVQDNQA